MKFTRLRVLGFKSFVEPTEFLIEPGLTGVVGPNGCGKSNLVEALRWVMGENSYKNMRASGMDDVIFQGSLNRPARNTAEVSLSVDNADRTAPAALNDSDQIEITRRIEREAGSVYRINGRDVRARDVTLLFADASTGAHSPAIVGQGKIGELIAAKPVDRRSLLEEAAGISGLHGRRHEAELRLRAAEQNLSRLDDVVREIEQQFDALKRQARQASRYRNLSGEIRKAEATVLHLRWQAASIAVTEANAQLQEAVDAATTRAEEQATAARVQAEAAVSVPELRDAAARAGAALQRIKLAAEQIDQEDRRIRARLAELDGRLTQLAADIAREQTMIGENAEAMERLGTEERELNSANAAMADGQAAAAEKRALAEEALKESERVLAELTQNHATIAARRRQAEKALADALARTGRVTAERANVTAELDATGALDLATATAAARAAVEEAERERDVRDGAIPGVEQALTSARSHAAAIRERQTETERAHDRIETEAATLAAILATDNDGRTPVVDSVSVDDGYETALGAAFGDDLDAPVDTDALAHWHDLAVQDAQTLPDGILPLSQFVQTPAVLQRRLAQTGLVAREDGTRLQATLKPGQRLVSREGDLWRWDGYVAAADAPRSAAQRLERRNRLTALTAELAVAKAGVADVRAEREAAESAVRAAIDAERAAREAQRIARKLVDDRRQALTSAEREEGRIATKRASLEERLSRLAADIVESETASEAARSEVAATGELDAISEQLTAQRQRVDGDRAALAEARAAFEGLAREAGIRNNRLAAIANERKSWSQRAENAERQVATLTERQAQAANEREQLAGEPAKLEEKRGAILSEISTAEAARAETADALAVAEKALSDADKAARVALEQLSEARERRGRAEERVTAAAQRLQEAADRIQEVLDCAPGEAFGIAELKIDAPLPDLAEVEGRLERYKQERERLGGVNLRADEEATEIGQRRDGLVAEREDLIQAIQRLRQGIGSLNREGRERLTAAFETVNGHFKRLFTHLFGGGTAELQLTESDDPLEAGLEIIARPPGKKPQVMTLLSGGEQALTAMSLIFAVFLTNPAPICVLDEVDAPLDDANVVRFCNLLDEMRRTTDTRFLVITHNPITMARMNRLFGVTMAERGVSQLVSVDLETAERFLEAS